MLNVQVLLHTFVLAQVPSQGQVIAIALSIHGEAYIQPPEIPIYTTLVPLQEIKKGSVIRIEPKSMVVFNIDGNIIRLFGPTTIKIEEIGREKGIRLIDGRIYGNFKRPFRLKTNRVSAVIRGTKVSVIKKEQEVWKVIKGTIDVEGMGSLEEGKQLNPDKGSIEKLVLDSIDLLNLALDARGQDTIPPAIKIEKTDVTSRKSYAFRVSTEPGAVIKFEGRRYTVDSTGEITLRTTLKRQINYLTLTVMDSAGNMSRAGFLVKLDTVPPRISIPLKSGLYSKIPRTAIPIEGEPGTIIKLHNGKQKEIPSFGHLEEVVSLDPGENRITITGFDEAGNTTRKEIRFIFDNTIPSIAVISPSDTLTNRSSITLKLRVVDERLKGVVVNGKVVPATNGIVTKTIPLKEGRNVFQIYAVDSAGNVSSTTIHVVRDTKPPLYKDKLEVDTYQTITGKAKPGSMVFINGNPVPVSPDGEFSYRVQLHKGKNIVIIRVVDMAGNETVEKKIIEVP